MRIRRSQSVVALAVLAGCALVGAWPARAQVPCGPADGLTGPCCALTQPVLPPFPAVAFADGKRVCFIDCGPQNQVLSPLTISAPAPLAGAGCGVYTASLGGGLATGTIRLHYTRSWVEVGGGPSRRVFRFAVTGNVTPIASPCAIESSAVGLAPPFFYGYLDYVYGCTGAAGPAFQAAAIVIGHSCDHFMHDPGCPFTALPGPIHPFDSTVLVAPGTNFLPSGTLTPPSGVAVGLPGVRQAVRALDPAQCTVNDLFSSLNLTNIVKECSCIQPPPANPQPFTRQEIKAGTVCGQGVGAAGICPYLPPPPVTQQTLYAWSVGSFFPGAYPGRPGGYRVSLAEGGLFVSTPQPCNGGPPQALRETVYGAETVSAFPPGQVQRRVDLVGNSDPVSMLPLVGGQGDAHNVLFFY